MSEGFRFELLAPEQHLLDEIADPAMKQTDVMLTYALALQSRDQVDWPKVNRAIIERWSMPGLRRIKEQAVRKAGLA